MDRFIPMRHSSRGKFPWWFSRDLRRALTLKSRYHKRYKSSGLNKWHSLFKEYRSAVKRLIKRDKCQLHDSIESDLKRCPDRLWEYVRYSRPSSRVDAVTLKTQTGHVSDSFSVCNLFAKHFSSIGNPNVPQSNNATLSSENPLLMSIPILTIDDVVSAIKELAPKKSCGEDGIPAFIVKGCSDILAPVLHHIFSMSLITSTFPSAWKTALVVPVHKSGSSTCIDNYRPIALLSAFSKVFEKVIFKRVSFHFKQTLSPNQHGFCRGRSVETNLLTFLEFAKPIVGSRGQVDVVYFDCSKAFDLVDHNLLLSKLSHMGLSSGFCDWFASYLGERSNMVSYLGCKSFPYLLKSGVPQGSNLGPLLFNIFVNDLVTSVSDSMALQYADDVKICRSIHTPVDCELLQKDIDAIHLWCCANSLVLNPTKTKVVSFSRKANVVHPYTLDGSEISRSSVVRDLGILIDSRLNFNYHVSKVINDSLRILGIISSITRDFRNYTCMLNLFTGIG